MEILTLSIIVGIVCFIIGEFICINISRKGNTDFDTFFSINIQNLIISGILGLLTYYIGINFAYTLIIVVLGSCLFYYLKVFLYDTFVKPYQKKDEEEDD